MDRILVGLLVGDTLASTVAILNSKSFLLWQKIILAILAIFFPAQWILAIIFYYANNLSDNNPDYKSSFGAFLRNFQTVDKNRTTSGKHPNDHSPSNMKNSGFNGSNPYSKK